MKRNLDAGRGDDMSHVTAKRIIFSLLDWTKVVTNMGLKPLAHAIMDPSVAYEWQTFRAADHNTAAAAFTQGERPVFGGGR